jgi:uncharacterized membrane protein YdjX (TVP38/TMEM64 family)
LTPLDDMLQPDRLRETLDHLRDAWWSPLALFGLYLGLAPLGVPLTPLILAGGLVFGPFWGWVISYGGSYLGGVISYYLGRALGRDFVAQLFGDRLRKFERMLNRHGFWAMVRLRFVPVPFPIANYGAALAGVRPATFLGSTAIGLAPAIFAFNYFSASLARAAADRRGAVATQLVFAAAGLLLVSLIPSVLIRWRRVRRHRGILARRAARPYVAPRLENRRGGE